MQVDVIESYENGEIQLDVCQLKDDKKAYWVKGGVGYIQFTENGFDDLTELIEQYHAEKTGKTFKVYDPWQFWTVIVALVLLAILIIGV